MSEPDTSSDGTVNRRRVLKMTGAAAVGGIAVTGTASAHRADEVVFCGCSQVCACGSGVVYAIVARETSNGFDCSRVPINTSDTPFSFCYEPGGNVKVLALQVGPTGASETQYVCNPNNCAHASGALAHCKHELGFRCSTYGQSGGPCGNAFLRNCGDSNDGRRGRGRGRGRGRRRGRGK